MEEVLKGYRLFQDTFPENLAKVQGEAVVRSKRVANHVTNVLVPQNCWVRKVNSNVRNLKSSFRFRVFALSFREVPCRYVFTNHLEQISEGSSIVCGPFTFEINSEGAFVELRLVNPGSVFGLPVKLVKQVFRLVKSVKR
jgi:hypothetical protein